jgi:murein DD-endopeptidase MepM/ murein hydrolase activator NlpD
VDVLILKRGLFAMCAHKQFLFHGFFDLPNFDELISNEDAPRASTWQVRWLLLAVLLATGAFAVAGFGNLDRSNVPIRQLVESVSNLSLDSQINSLSKDKIRLYRTDTSRATDTAESLLARLGMSDKAAADFMRSNPLVRESLMGKNARLLNAEVDDDNLLLKLTARWATESNDTFQRLVIERSELGLSAYRETGELKPSVRLSGGLIQTSLFAATDEARIPDSIALQLADIFSGDIDFHRALRKGDHFSVSYESLEADGEVLKPGKVLSAEFVNKGKSHQAMWFQDSPQRPGGYYNLQGQSLRRTYLASPLAFSRVSSGFSMRLHPIFKTWRAHLGVDYAAAQGTPVRSVGSGVVQSAGNMGGYGNAVVVKHNNGHTTLYAHLSKILVKPGQSVAQSQAVGRVGATGWATGPHLHFEFRVNGVHVDPQKIIQQAQSGPIPPASMARFVALVNQAQSQLQAAAQMREVNSQ